MKYEDDRHVMAVIFKVFSREIKKINVEFVVKMSFFITIVMQ